MYEKVVQWIKVVQSLLTGRFAGDQVWFRKMVFHVRFTKQHEFQMENKSGFSSYILYAHKWRVSNSLNFHFLCARIRQMLRPIMDFSIGIRWVRQMLRLVRFFDRHFTFLIGKFSLFFLSDSRVHFVCDLAGNYLFTGFIQMKGNLVWLRILSRLLGGFAKFNSPNRQLKTKTPVCYGVSWFRRYQVSDSCRWVFASCLFHRRLRNLWDATLHFPGRQI